MTKAEILDRLESGSSIELSGKIEGLGEAFCLRVLSFYGADNEKLSALGQHWRTVLRACDDRHWAYRAGGIYLRLQGQWKSSAHAFLKSGELATDPHQKASFSIGAVDSLARQGLMDEADNLAEKLSSQLLELHEPGSAGRVWLNLGNAYVYRDDSFRARKVLGMAVAHLKSSHFQLEYASALTALSSTHIFGGDPKRALEYAQEAISLANDLDAKYLANLAEINLGLANNCMNQCELALQRFQNLALKFENSSVDKARVCEYLADTYFQLNLFREASIQYQSTIAEGLQTIPLHQAHLWLGLGQCQARLDQQDLAQKSLKIAASIYRKLKNQTWLSLTMLEQAKIDIAEGRKKRGRKRLEDARTLAKSSPYFSALVALALAEIEPESLTIASRLIKKYGFVGLAWKCEFLAAKYSLKPIKHYRKMMQLILIDRASKGTETGLSYSLQDKSEGISHYLEYLFDSRTPKRIKEAREVIEQLRSTLLLTELLDRKLLSSLTQAKIQQVADLASHNHNDFPRGSRRIDFQQEALDAPTSFRLADLHFDLNLSVKKLEARSSDCHIFWAGKDLLRVITNDRCKTLSMKTNELMRLLKWLSFELSAAPIKGTQSKFQVQRLMNQISEPFAFLWQSQSTVICPDSVGWSLPWNALARASGDERCWRIAMHPSFDSKTEPLHLDRCLIILGNTEGLQHTQKEIDQISGYFQESTIIQTKSEFRNLADSSFSAVHVLGHAQHKKSNPMLSSIQLVDGPLFAFEISKSGLKTDLATLSACDTGLLSSEINWEPNGLSRAFISCGTKNVLASLWELDDSVAPLMYGAFYKTLAEKNTVSEAFLTGQRICRDENDHPYYWGSFVHYSGFSK